jgi:DNA mismatch repair protein MutL
LCYLSGAKMMVEVTPAAGERPRIRLLPPEIANRIAAGEVVERPASVVKELCENAIDAGARTIEIDLERGGIALVRVRDDGAGIPPDEAPLALLRHATSKIREARDLEAIATLGFRGEALPSIAAVSRFVLQTRIRGDDAGTRVEVLGGQEPSVRAAGCPVGTLVEVRDLFFNTPARRKFLRSERSEAAHAVEAVARLALAAPAIDFRVRVDGREALTAPAARTLEDRAAQVLQPEVARHLYPCEGTHGRVRAHGLVGDPTHARGRPDGLYTYVNGRHVRDRILQHAIQAAYLPVLDRGRWAWVILFVEVPPDAVDVNVHPGKSEVRFADGGAVHRAVERVVAQALERAPWAKGPARTYVLAAGGERPAAAEPERIFGTTPLSLRTPTPSFVRPVRSTEAEATRTTALPAPSIEPNPAAAFAALRVLGQVHRTYIVCEGPEEVVLIDQHAAHERVTFERLRAAFREGSVPAQPLLFPMTLELSALEREAAEAYAPELKRLGFELEPFGSDTVALRAAPAVLGARDAASTAQELLGELCRIGRASALEERVEALLATVACHASVRAGDPLTVAECEALLGDLDRVDFQGNCPHGRPVALRARLADLERGFGRR